LTDSLPVQSPGEVAKNVVDVVVTLRGTPAVQEADNVWYVDLGDAAVRECLPFGLTPLTAKEALTRARLTRRATKKGLASVGWASLPTFGVVFAK